MSDTTNFDADAIPEELRARDQWLMWDNSSDTPRRPHWRGDFFISWNDPDDWHSFDEAVEAASERESWGIGYVFANSNDDYPRGIYGGLDLDGCADPETGPKEWLPSLQPFFEHGAYMEKSPSKEGVHIPLAGFEPPEWWSNVFFTDEEHEGVEAYGSKFFTFTGDALSNEEWNNYTVADTGDWVEDWLAEAYEVITGDDPRAKPTTEDKPDIDSDYSGGEWFDVDTASEALDHIDPDVDYGTWRDIGFALADEFPSGTAEQLFTHWSSGGQKWDDEAERQAERIINESTPGGGRSIATLVYYAKEGGWEPPTAAKGGPDVTASAEVQATDGGAAAVSPDAPDPQDSEPTIRERMATEVITPFDPPEDWEGETISYKVAVDRAARIIDEEMSFVRPRESTRGWRDCLYVYIDGEKLGRASEAGIFEANAKAELERMGERLFGPIANDSFVREWVNKVERRNRVRARTLEPAEERLVVNNGVLDLTTGELSPHSPDEYHRVKVEHDYNPDAECPRIDEFLHSVVDDSDVDTLYRFIAHALYKGYPEAKAAMLLGDGANGKSMFLSLVEKFIGEFNVSGRSLQDITEYRWAANDLVGKLANVHADMSDQDVDSMRMFKQLTGEDTVDADVKFEKPIKFTNHATMLFACNDMPVLKDDTQGNWRRWVLINFPNTFDDDDPAAQDAKPRSQLERELFAESEMEGLLARCVEEIRAWYDGRAWFPDVPDWRATRSKMRRAAEPLFDFAEACLRSTGEGYVEKKRVREAYQQYATQEGLPKMGREEFGRKLMGLVDYNIEPAQPREKNGPGRIQAYKGIELNARGLALLDEEGAAFAPKEAVMKVMRNEDGSMPEALVVERLEKEYGIDNGRSQHAVDSLKKNGTLLASERHGVDWVEIT